MAGPPPAGAVANWLCQRSGWLIVLTWLASAGLYLTLPPSTDQFAHAYLGWRLVSGEVPYRDFIDMNWPGVMGVHALAIGAFGVNLWSWRAMDFLLFAGSALCLADLVRQAAGPLAGRVSLLLTPLIYIGATYGIAGQHDMTAAQFLMAALWLHVRGHERGQERRSYGWQLASGCLLGLAMLNKPTVGLFALIVPIQSLWLGTPKARVLARACIAGAATAATVVLAFALVLAHGTALSELVAAVYTYNVMTQFIGAKSLAQLLNPAVSWTWVAATFACLPAMPWLFSRAHRSAASTALPVLWLVGLLSYVVQARGYPYHLSPSFLAMAGGVALSVTLVGSGQVGLPRWLNRKSARFGFAAVLLATVAGKVVASYHSLLPAVAKGRYALHLARFQAGDGLTHADMLALVQQVRAAPKDKCPFVVGSAVSVNYLSQRSQPTPFYIIAVIANANPPMPMAGPWLARWEADLAKLDCAYIFVSQPATDWLKTEGPAPAALRKLLADKYQRVATVGGRDMVVMTPSPAR